MSISINYNSQYLAYAGDGFSILPNSVVGENLTFSLSITIIKNLGTEANLKKYVVINPTTGEVYTTTKSTFYLKAFRATINVTATNGTESTSRSFTIDYSNKSQISVNYYNDGDDPNYYYWYFVVGEEHTYMNEHIKLYGYNPSYTVISADDASNPLINLPGLFLNYKQSKYTQYELYAEGIDRDIGATDVGSTSFTLQIAVGPNDNRVSSTISIIAETFPTPSITYRSNYNIFSGMDFVINPETVENDIQIVYSSTSDKTISVNSSSGVVSGNIIKTKSYSLSLRHPKIKQANWSKSKSLKLTVVNPTITYDNYFFFKGQRVNINPELVAYNNTNITATNTDFTINSSTGNISGIAADDVTIPINFKTYDDVNNEKSINTSVAISIITENEVYGEQNVYVNNDIYVKPKFTIPITGTTIFSCVNLPSILSIDPNTGIITRKALLNSSPNNRILTESSNKGILTEGSNKGLLGAEEPLETYEFNIDINHEGETPEESFTKSLPMTLSILPPSITYTEINQYAYTDFTATPIVEGTITSFSCDDLHGFNLDSSTGVITGTINQIGTVELTITGTDGTAEGTATTVLTIVGNDPTITQLSYDNISSTINNRISLLPENDGHVLNYTITSGRLPLGLRLNEQTGEISGKLREQFENSVEITATTYLNSITYTMQITVGGLFIIYYVKQ